MPVRKIKHRAAVAVPAWLKLAFALQFEEKSVAAEFRRGEKKERG